MKVKLMFRNFLVFLLAVCLQAQQIPEAQPGARSSEMQTTAIRIIPLIGDNAINSIPLRTSVEPVIEVRDQNDRPIEGAEVTFELPQAGPGASFGGQSNTFTTRTNSQGQAAAVGMRANTQAGQFRIKVTATHAGVTGQQFLTQTNSLKEVIDDEPKQGRSKRWLWIAAIGGGAAAAVILATTGGSSSTESGVVSVNPGAVTVGGPR